MKEPGLGLAICKRLVSLMGGEISINSELGLGSTFEFTVKLDKADVSHNGDDFPQELQNQLPSANTRILLAEDNPANQMVIKSILEFADLQVDVVANGYEAIEAVRNLPYDIVLMDISMPEMDGMTATQEIRKLPGDERNIAIVALTAHTLNGDKERFIDAGMNDYLSKPIDRLATLNCIARWTAKTVKENKQEIVLNNEDDSDNAYVCENVLQQLVRDTSAEIVPELMLLYIEDSKARMELIKEAIDKQDISTLEFETHTIGSSAIAHGNSKLHDLARNIEHLCQQQQAQQAFTQAGTMITVAEESFRLLALRAEQGFG
ncbi:response regulator [Psychromonas sp. KJ10-10]|uniref:response regulator n=1 Tax=Psychromonas sp. KJ10-10 TaxID=3391823 RepID=UPI0039B5038B